MPPKSKSSRAASAQKAAVKPKAAPKAAPQAAKAAPQAVKAASAAWSMPSAELAAEQRAKLSRDMRQEFADWAESENLAPAADIKADWAEGWARGLRRRAAAKARKHASLSPSAVSLSAASPRSWTDSLNDYTASAVKRAQFAARSRARSFVASSPRSAAALEFAGKVVRASAPIVRRATSLAAGFVRNIASRVARSPLTHAAARASARVGLAALDRLTSPIEALKSKLQRAAAGAYQVKRRKSSAKPKPKRAARAKRAKSAKRVSRA